MRQTQNNNPGMLTEIETEVPANRRSNRLNPEQLETRPGRDFLLPHLP
jgi:hypothetical protein